MSYSSSSAQDRLDAVRAAIERCLASQEYSIGASGRRQRMAELKTLSEMEQRLIQEVNESGGNGGNMCSLGMIG